MSWIWHGLYGAAAMFWETLWALVLGFTLSGVVQTFVSKEQMTRAFGKAGLREVALATGLGAASSSCSYAAAATAKTAFKKGASLVPALAFMFASTNLVFELGLVLWLLMGWQFVLAEFVGALVLIGLMWLIIRLTLPKGLEDAARQHEETGSAGCAMHHEHGGEHGDPAAQGPFLESIKHLDNWARVASAFVMDVSMLWKEIGIGFLIAGFLAVLVPDRWWQGLFLNQTHSVQTPGVTRLIENAVVGPLIAVASFVCSIGNIPLASVLWAGGISFGGVISFIYADLIIIPLIIAYKKYYGLRAALYITLVMFAAMVGAGIIVDLLFNALHLVPTGQRPLSAVEMASFRWNYTTFLDLIAIALTGFLIVVHQKQHPTMPAAHCHDMHEHDAGHCEHEASTPAGHQH